MNEQVDNTLNGSPTRKVVTGWLKEIFKLKKGAKAEKN